MALAVHGRWCQANKKGYLNCLILRERSDGATLEEVELCLLLATLPDHDLPLLHQTARDVSMATFTQGKYIAHIRCQETFA